MILWMMLYVTNDIIDDVMDDYIVSLKKNSFNFII